MRIFVLFCALWTVSATHGQNVGINTNNPHEQLHIRSDSTRMVLRLDNKKSAQAGFDYFTVLATPTQVTNAPSIPNQTPILWTDLTHSKLINSDDIRIIGPILNIAPEYSSIQIRFLGTANIPSNAIITDISINGEWRRTSVSGGTLNNTLYLTSDANFNGVATQQNISSNIDQTIFTSITHNLTPAIINNGQYYLLINTFNWSNFPARLEIDKFSLEISYKTPSTSTQNTSWATGTSEGIFKITNSGDLKSKEYLTIDESGITNVKGLKIEKNAGQGKVLTSNQEGRAYWADVPGQDIEVLWINKQDTAFYARGPIQINNNVSTAAIIFNKGESKINNGVNMIETKNRLLNVIIDADNDQNNEQFNIYKDSSQILNQSPAIRFGLGGNDSWINGGGNTGIGTNTPQQKLSVIGAVRASFDSTEAEFLEIKHGGNNAIINTVGDGRLYFQHENTTRMSITEEGKVGIGFLNPTEHLDVNGAIKMGNTTNSSPVAGTIRWNETSNDFEGFDGNMWKSLTKCGSTTQNNNTGMPNSTPACCEEQHTGSTSIGDQHFGTDVAIYGTFAAVIDQTNKIFVFIYENGIWVEDTILTLPDCVNCLGEFDDVEMSEDYILIGDGGYNVNIGRILIYKRESGNIWSTPEIIVNPTAQAANFGNYISLTNDYIVVGTSAEGVYIYKNSGSGNEWTLDAHFSNQECLAVCHFGNVIAVANDVTDEIDFYSKIGSFWGVTQTISNGYIGKSMDMYGDYMVVGNPEFPYLQGSARVYKKDTNNVWSQIKILNPTGTTTNSPNQFGIDVSIWGDYIIVGSLADVDTTANDNKGKAYVYHYDGTTWIEQEVVFDPIGTNYASFSKRVSTDGINRIIGIPNGDVNGTIDQGKVEFGPID